MLLSGFLGVRFRVRVKSVRVRVRARCLFERNRFRVEVRIRVRVRVRGDSCPMNQSQNVMAYAIIYIPFHCGACNFSFAPSMYRSAAPVLFW